MKKILREFYPLEKDYFENLWKEAIIIPDANILLNLYCYRRKVYKELISIFKKFSKRLWIPYQIALEYQRNRISKIRFQKEPYETIKNSVLNKLNSIEKELEKYSIHPFIEATKIKEILESCKSEIEKYLKKLEDSHPDWELKDEIRDEIDILFSGKVGEPYSKDKLMEYYSIGFYRYQNQIPPGYCDEIKKKEKGSKFGDLIIWLDMIEKAKYEKKPIIFITDEKKEDWWQKEKEKIPRYELIGEMRLEANESFYMYDSLDFLKESYKFFKKPPKTEIIKEVKEYKDFLEDLRVWNESIGKVTKPFSEAIARTMILSTPLIESIDKASIQLADAVNKISISPIVKIIEEAVTAQKSSLEKVMHSQLLDAISKISDSAGKEDKSS